MNYYENKYREYEYIAGVDEVGRGCLFGPVVACSIVMEKNFDYSQINDSKKLSKQKREILYDYILDNCICYSVTEIDNTIIDKINILEATKLAMKTCINDLKYCNIALIDAVKLDCDCETIPIIKGDTLSYSIACASIIAKVYRDRLITKLAKNYPYYSLETNMGYGTKKHIEGLRDYGITPLHRISFNPVREFKGKTAQLIE
ncbi:MAG: ribonuclease HII [Bacilli bacterium]